MSNYKMCQRCFEESSVLGEDVDIISEAECMLGSGVIDGGGEDV